MMLRVLCKYSMPLTNNGSECYLLSNVTKYKQSLNIIRQRNTRPDQRFRKQRREKVKRVELPDWESILGDRKTPKSIEQVKRELKKLGVLPPRRYESKVVNVQCTSGIFEPYVPPEGDGKASLISTKGMKERYSTTSMKTQSVNAVRKIRQLEEGFKAKDFAEEGLDVYKRANQALASYDLDLLHQLVTEHAFMEMLGSSESRFETIKWEFLKLLEPVRTVHVRTTDLLGKSNVFAQCTVRIHSQQMLAVYDRFGRLMHGSEVQPKTVLEYVVFERQMANQTAGWRVHGKIKPEWMVEPEPMERTIRVDGEVEEEEEEVEGVPRPISLSRSVSA